MELQYDASNFKFPNTFWILSDPTPFKTVQILAKYFRWWLPLAGKEAPHSNFYLCSTSASSIYYCCTPGLCLSIHNTGGKYWTVVLVLLIYMYKLLKLVFSTANFTFALIHHNYMALRSTSTTDMFIFILATPDRAHIFMFVQIYIDLTFQPFNNLLFGTYCKCEDIY